MTEKSNSKLLFFVSALMVVLLAFLTYLTTNKSVAAEASDGRVDTVSTSQGDTYFYVPENSENLDRITPVPIFLVFGDEDYTAESAKQTAIDSGLAEIAYEEGSIVAFVNSAGDEWSEADAEVYLELLDHFSGSTFEATVTEGGKYPGFVERVYVYGEGSGADFVSENLTEPIILDQGEEWGLRDLTPAFITLFNQSVLPSIPEDYDNDFPIVAVNPVNGTEEILQELNQKNGLYAIETSDVTEGFDRDLILSTYSVGSRNRRIESVIVQFPDFQAEGITEIVESRELSTGSILYHQYVPNHLDLEQEGSIPLVIDLHGFGDTAEYQSLTSEWPLIGKNEDFMVVAINAHLFRSSEDIIELLDILFDENPAIDQTRVYASGFSFGGLNTWRLGINYPEYFAGIVPNGLGATPEREVDESEHPMPLFYIGGARSPLEELPSTPDPNSVNDALAYFLKLNGVENDYLFDDSADASWGIAPSDSYSFSDPVLGRDTVVNFYESEDGQTYTALAAVDKSHLVYNTDAQLAWEFISQFSRNPDGTITVGSEDDPGDDLDKLEGRIDLVTTNQGDTYFYVPEESENLDRVSIVPITLVFGDEHYTRESAHRTAIDSGLAEIAKEEGSIVVFVNPEGDTWSERDADTYLEILTHFTENEGFASAGESGPYPGFVERTFVYGEGSGADFVAEHLAKEVILDQGPEWGLRDLTPAFISLYNNTVLPEVTDYNNDLPIVAVNSIEGTEERLAELNRRSELYAVETSEIRDGFDNNLILSTYEIGGANRRIESVIVQLPDYEAEGIIETIEVKELSTGSIRYHHYIPNHLDLDQEGSIPLVMIYHGGGNTGEFHSLTSDWPLVGKEEGFMVVSVDRHMSNTTEENIELLDMLFEEYPAIDQSRVYASGFSMGAVQSWDLAARFPEYFAGIAPNGAGMFLDDQLEVLPYKIPIYYVGGAISPLAELPSKPDHNVVDDALAFFLEMNGIDDNYQYDANADVTWGIAPTDTYSTQDELFGRDIDVSYYMSDDGEIYTALAAVDKSHLAYGSDAWLAWDFISQFSRNSDGTITIHSDDIEDIESVIEDLEEQIHEITERLEELENLLAEERAEFEQTIADLRAELADLQAGEEELLDIVDGLLARIEALENRVSELEEVEDDEATPVNDDPEDPEETDDSDEDTDADEDSAATDDSDDEAGETLPKTATSIYNFLLIGALILIAGAGLALYSYKRRRA